MNPWVARNVLFPLHEFAKGHSTYRILREMEVADRLSLFELQELQLERLRALIAYSYSHVPFYTAWLAQARLDPSDIRSLADLRLLPVMTKTLIRDNQSTLHSRVARSLSSFSTGGSTGEPLTFALGKIRVSARVACRQRVAGWWNVSVGDREFALWGSPVELSRQDLIRSLRDWSLSSKLLSAFEMNEDTMSRYLDLIARRGCRQMFGYPSAIYLLCLHARKQNRNLRSLGLKVVFVTGEVLLPYQRDLISETLQCPVANGYGGRDSGFISHECPQGGMHILADTSVVELLDESHQPVPPGQLGQIVVTDLYSHEAPFIRYATGDLAVFSSRRCACGRALPVFQRIEGRSNDAIIAPDGRIINSLALIYPVREIDGIQQFRIIQKQLDFFVIQVIRNSRFNLSGEQSIRSNWSKLLRTPVVVTFEYVDQLPLDRSGKFRHVISEVLKTPFQDTSSGEIASRPVPVAGS